MEEDTSPGYHDNAATAPPAGRVDIAQFVVQVEKFNCMIEPFAFVLYLWDDLRRWRYPVLTVILWIAGNLACFILTKAAVFTLVSLLVVAIALMCLVQLHSRVLDKFLPVTDNADPWSDEPVDEHLALQTVRDFKFSVRSALGSAVINRTFQLADKHVLMQMHDFVVKCNEYLRYFYSLLKWDYTGPSLKFHAEVCFVFLCLVVFPTRWTVLLLTNWFFLATEDVYYGVRVRSVLLVEYFKGKRTLASVFEKRSPTANGSLPQDKKTAGAGETEGEVTGLTDADKLYDTGQDDFEEGEEGAGDRASQGENKPGMVARLMELKRRRKLIANECCFECKTSFSSILKRRYCCCHCGNNFCSKCCNQKVPKSLLGATAPTAQTETVLVCVVCHKMLNEDRTKQESKDKTA